MKKSGFTLIELLVTVGVVGILAAILAPGLAGMLPDENKSRYLKAYNTLTSQTSDILNDASLYWPTAYNAQGVPQNDGLDSFIRPAIAPYSEDVNCGTDNKFAAILSHRLNLAGEPSYLNNITQFTTMDGMVWTFDAVKNNQSPDNSGQTIHVTIDVNGGEAPNSVMAAGVRHPDQFTFEIDNYGEVVASDALGLVYLNNSSDLKSTKADRRLAEQVLQAAGANASANDLANTLNLLKNNTTLPQEEIKKQPGFGFESPWDE